MQTSIAQEPRANHRRPMPRVVGRFAAAFLIAAAALTLTAGTTHAIALEAEAASPRIGTVRPTWMVSPTNAALLYQRAWATISTDQEKILSDSASKLEKGAAPDGDFVDQLKDAQGYIGMIINASRLPGADWGVEYDKGFSALIPHVGQLRRSVRIIIADSRRLFAASQNQDGVERLATVLRMSRHGGDGFLICSLVGVVHTRFALEEIDAAVAGNRIDAAGARVLLDALKPLTNEDPFAFRKAIESEAWVALGWMREQFGSKGKDAGKSLMDSMGGFGNAALESNDWKQIAAMDADTLVKDLDKGIDFYTAIANAWNAPEAKTRLADLETAVSKGEYGIIMKVLAASFTKAHDSATKITKPIADTKAKLEALAK